MEALARLSHLLLLLLAVACCAGGVQVDIPRIVWIAWFQGWDNAPEVSKRCLQSWRDMNPGWDIRAIDGTEDYVSALNIKTTKQRYKMANQSDLLRLVLLEHFGGVWVDSTMLCRRPLDDWLPEMLAPSGFFAFDDEDDLPVMSSFLAARRKHPIIREWRSHLQAYFDSPQEDLGYFAVHQVFGLVTNGSYPDAGDRAQHLWKRTPRMSARYGEVGPHFWVPYEDRLAPSCTPNLRHAIETDRTTPVWKLTHYQVSWDKSPEDSCFKLIFQDKTTSLRAQRPRLVSPHRNL